MGPPTHLPTPARHLTASSTMASRKDMRRADLIVPYAEPEKAKDDNDMSSTLSSTLPMAAIFTRNKMIGWVAVVFTIQSWLAETPEQKKTSTTPAYFQVGMSPCRSSLPTRQYSS